MESTVKQLVNRDSREHGSGSSEKWIVALRAELCEILGLFDEYRCQLAAAQPLRESMELEDSGYAGCVDTVSSAPAAVTVCCLAVIPQLFTLLTLFSV